ncbi:hypothetical protein GGS23DRAFT_615137 [Durotheca rogersii]|uniref:uncharacterized protein n=1 Tax=Durotheca rogersii TaxID=419775 RepID=UPI00221F5135|nr:uncharacterized protein GGS23DRAFT_615137 [Durotheca rogersii]KAI5866592.1 hypothetical protein GGS23DRAFT_615137 [Durotheca rogersii]
MTGNLTSSGRGGAGNIVDSAKSPKIQPADLETPTLKTAIFPTGRGGSGNMAPNVDPALTRALQDVEPVERTPTLATHIGRGGAANVVRTTTTGGSSSEEEAATHLLGGGNEGGAAAAATGSQKKDAGLATKAKELFKKA